jgi:hypothetical protein
MGDGVSILIYERYTNTARVFGCSRLRGPYGELIGLSNGRRGIIAVPWVGQIDEAIIWGIFL